MDNLDVHNNYFEFVDEVHHSLHGNDKSSIYFLHGDCGYLTATLTIRDYHKLRLLWSQCPTINICDGSTHVSLHLYVTLLITETPHLSFPQSLEWIEHVHDILSPVISTNFDMYRQFLDYLKTLIEQERIIDIVDVIDISKYHNVSTVSVLGDLDG